MRNEDRWLTDKFLSNLIRILETEMEAQVKFKAKAKMYQSIVVLANVFTD